MLHADPLRLAQQRGAPVEHREADDVDEEVGDAQNPNQRVAEDMLAQEGAVFGPLGGCGILLVLRLGPLQLGKAHRRGGVAQEDGQRDGSRERDAGRKPEAPAPGPRMGGSDAHVAHDVAAENHHQSGANRVRGVPPRHLRGQLGGGHPVGQQPRAGREARPLQHAVDHPHDAHEEYHRVGELRAVVFARKPVGDIFAESEGEVREGAERQTDGHVPAGVLRSASTPLTKRERP